MFVDELMEIWNRIDALDTLTEAQRLHTDCVKVQFLYAAADIKAQVAAESKDYDSRQEARDYETLAQAIMERAGRS